MEFQKSPVLVRMEKKTFSLKKVGNTGNNFLSLEERRGSFSRRCFLSSEGGLWLANILLKLRDEEGCSSRWRRGSDSIAEISARMDSNYHGRFLRVSVLPSSVKGNLVVLLIPEERNGYGWKSLGEVLLNFSQYFLSHQLPSTSWNSQDRQGVDFFSFKEALMGRLVKGGLDSDVNKSVKCIKVVLDVNNNLEGWKDAALCLDKMKTKFIEGALNALCIEQPGCVGEAELMITAVCGDTTQSHNREVEDEVDVAGTAKHGALGLDLGGDQSVVRETARQSEVNDFILNSLNEIAPRGHGQTKSEGSRVSGCDLRDTHVYIQHKPNSAGLVRRLGQKETIGPDFKSLEAMEITPVMESLGQIIETSSLRTMERINQSPTSKKKSRIFRRKIIQEEIAKADHTLLTTPPLLEAPSQQSSFNIEGKRKNLRNIVLSDSRERIKVKEGLKDIKGRNLDLATKEVLVEEETRFQGGSLYDEVLVAEDADMLEDDIEFLRLGKSFASYDNEKRGKEIRSEAEEEEEVASPVERTKLHSLNSMLLSVGARMGIRDGPPRIQLPPWIKDLDKRLQQRNRRSKRTTAGRKPRRFRDSSHSEVM